MTHKPGRLADIYALERMTSGERIEYGLPFPQVKREPTAYDLMTPEQRKQAHEEMEAELQRQAAQCG